MQNPQVMKKTERKRIKIDKNTPDTYPSIPHTGMPLHWATCPISGAEDAKIKIYLMTNCGVLPRDENA